MELLLEAHPDFLEAYEGLDMVHNRQGEIDKAIACMGRLLEKDPKSIMAHSNLSVFYMKKGMKEKAEEEKALATVLRFEHMGKKKRDEAS